MNKNTTVHSTIKFGLCYVSKRISFSDITFHKTVTRKLGTTYKKKNRQVYLYGKFEHPESLNCHIPFCTSINDEYVQYKIILTKITTNYKPNLKTLQSGRNQPKHNRSVQHLQKK